MQHKVLDLFYYNANYSNNQRVVPKYFLMHSLLSSIIFKFGGVFLLPSLNFTVQWTNVSTFGFMGYG
jgi:hypothetical protein